MPLTRVSLRRGKYRRLPQGHSDGLHHAMRETFEAPEHDRFMTIAQHDEDEFSYGAKYLGIERSDDLVIIQLTVSNTRTVAQKQALYRRIVERLTDSPGLRPEESSSTSSRCSRRTGHSAMALPSMFRTRCGDEHRQLRAARVDTP